MVIVDLRVAQRPARSAPEAKDIWRSQMALRLVYYKRDRLQISGSIIWEVPLSGYNKGYNKWLGPPKRGL
jgi:hypothetical protein